MTDRETRARTHWHDCWRDRGHERCAVARLDRLHQIVNEQACDDGLWFRAQHVTEDYLQVALRRLHAAIEVGEK